MSSYGYQTTTVEYYEYLMPDSREYNYESVAWPLQAAVSDSYVTRPLAFLNYLTDLQDHMEVASDNSQHSEIIYHMMPQRQRQRQRQQQTIIEFSGQDESDSTALSSNPSYENQNAPYMSEENEYQTENGDTSASEPHTNKKPGKKNIYRAKQGYLVEEPTSESEEDTS